MTAFRDASALAERRDRLLEENTALRQEVAGLEVELEHARDLGDAPENRDAFLARAEEDYQELRELVDELRALLEICDCELADLAADKEEVAVARAFQRQDRELRLRR